MDYSTPKNQLMDECSHSSSAGRSIMMELPNTQTLNDGGEGTSGTQRCLYNVTITSRLCRDVRNEYSSSDEEGELKTHEMHHLTKFESSDNDDDDDDQPPQKRIKNNAWGVPSGSGRGQENPTIEMATTTMNLKRRAQPSDNTLVDAVESHDVPAHNRATQDQCWENQAFELLAKDLRSLTIAKHMNCEYVDPREEILFYELASKIYHFNGEKSSSLDFKQAFQYLTIICATQLQKLIEFLKAPNTLEHLCDKSYFAEKETWAFRSLFSPSPWCTGELFPKLRQFVALLAKMGEVHITELFIGIYKANQTIHNKKALNLLEQTLKKCLSEGKSESSYPSPVILRVPSSSNFVPVMVDQGARAEAITFAKYEIIKEINQQVPNIQNAPQMVNEEVQQVPCHESLDGIAFPFFEQFPKLIEMTLAHPSTHLLEGNICSLLKLIAILYNNSSPFSYSKTLLQWTILRVLDIKMTPSILKATIETIHAITLCDPKFLNILCPEPFTSPPKACGAGKICNMLMEFLINGEPPTTSKNLGPSYVNGVFYVGTLTSLLELIEFFFGTYNIPWIDGKRETQCQCLGKIVETALHIVIHRLVKNDSKAVRDGLLEKRAICIIGYYLRLRSNMIIPDLPLLELLSQRLVNLMVEKNSEILSCQEVQTMQHILLEMSSRRMSSVSFMQEN